MLNTEREVCTYVCVFICVCMHTHVTAMHDSAGMGIIIIISYT